jgi:hypothetical protein
MFVTGALLLLGVGSMLAQDEKPANATVYIRDYCDAVTLAAIGCNRTIAPVPSTAAGFITLSGFAHCKGATNLEMSQCADWFIQHNSAMVKNLLEFDGGFAALMYCEIGFSPHIYGVQVPIILNRYARARA